MLCGGAEMKIMALRIQPIARVVAAIYAVFGATFWIAYCFSKAPYLTLPVGIVAPWVNFSFNFHFYRTTDLVFNVLFLLGSVAAYALTGWLTAMALVICFNVAARWKGGIDADFVSFRGNRQAETALGE
jgi:hypothetical protein